MRKYENDLEMCATKHNRITKKHFIFVTQKISQ